MKIIAHFDSPDSADFAAGALKNALSPLASIETKEYSAQNSTNKTPKQSGHDISCPLCLSLQ